MNDISAVAQQVEIYDSYPTGGWGTVAGTSISSPLVGGMYGLAGNRPKLTAGENLWKLDEEAVEEGPALHQGGQPRRLPAECTRHLPLQRRHKEFGNYSAGSGWGTPNGLGAL